MKRQIFWLILLMAGLQIPALAQQYEDCWRGTMGRSIPVFLHFQQSGDLIIGEIVYLKTKARIPIAIIGARNKSGEIRLKEFEKDGNISGIMQLNEKEDSLIGSWFRPRSIKEFKLSLKKVDTLWPCPDIRSDTFNMFGEYQYRYGEEGYAGFLDLEKLNDRLAEFTLSSVTSAPGRNIADIGTDTIPIPAVDFNYKLRFTDSCAIHIRFFKHFAQVNTLQDEDCGFGAYARLDGIYFKVK